ncbi:MAG TPA: glycoside hydrolase family 3 N-terminal domain-containing protein [Candidatus Acidoferrum sp.]|nr:glycoside hydrolase family 3 N-terminal domain-containing protein [Candidatus Acidoferrum sp.]
MTSPLHRSAVAALVLLLCPLAPSPAPSSQKAPRSDTSAPALSESNVEKKIDELLHKMTLEEKVGQLVQYSAGQPTGPGTGRTDYDDMIRKGEVGALFNITTARQVNAFQHVAVEQSRLHIPLLFGLDVIHGFRTEFPIPLGLSATWNPDLIQQTARVAAQEASASGIRWTFSPMVDIARDARWGRMTEGSGEDPYLGSMIARAYVRGYQGTHLDAPDSIAACAKHFVGYGAAEGGRDYNSTEISEHTLREFYLPPFHAAVEEGAATIMSAFNSLNGVPSSANPFTLTQILRKEWGFQGIVDSDYTSLAELMNHGIAIDGATAARKAFLAGVDMDMVSSLYHDHMAQLVKSGEVPEAAVDEAVRHILRVKFALGLFEHPYADETKEAGAMLQKDSVLLARNAAEQSFVLLKNAAVGSAPLLPLSANTKNIALIGPLANDKGNMLGSWGGLGRSQDVITLRTALNERIGAQSVHYAKGAEITGGTDDQLTEAVKVTEQADVVILALGENAGEMTGEAASRAFLGFPGRQEELLEKIVGTGKPIVLIIFSGRPLTLPWAFQHVPAVMAAWFPGIQAGPALVRTLFGDANPSGRLTVSWPRSVGQEPLYYNALNTGRPAGRIDLTRPPRNGQEKYVSRYIDEQNSPQFPFGFGLSYTTFTYGNLHVDKTKISAASLNEDLQAREPKQNAALSASADVTNTGTRPGVETVQCYLRFQGTSTAQPVRALSKFQRISLAPGETKKVTFLLGPSSFAIWNDQQKFAAEPAKVTVWIAPNSSQGIQATLEITK